MNRVFIQIDNDQNIIGINSDKFLDNFNNWILIDSGEGEKYLHAQNFYLNKPVITGNKYNYKYLNDNIVEVEEESLKGIAYSMNNTNLETNLNNDYIQNLQAKTLELEETKKTVNLLEERIKILEQLLVNKEG